MDEAFQAVQRRRVAEDARAQCLPVDAIGGADAGKCRLDGCDERLVGPQQAMHFGIGVVNHCNTVVEPPEHVARLIRRALEYIPAERLVITTDCGFGREGLSRRIAYYKCVSLVEGTNIVRRELGLPEARVRAADPRLWFASGPE